MTRLGARVEYGDVIYQFDSEEDAIGIVNCYNDCGGRPKLCAIEWRCVSCKTIVNEKSVGLER